MTKTITRIAAAALMATAFSAASVAQPVGYSAVTALANSDTFVSVPFTQVSEGELEVATVTASGVTVTAPLADNYQTVYYVRFTTGSAAGQWSTISNNTSGTSTVNFANTAFLGSIAAGDKFEVFRHQTLGSVFPDGHVGYSFAASSSAFVRPFEVLLPSTASGTNKAPALTYYFLSSAQEWRQVGATGSKDNVVLAPQSYFILRNKTAGDLTFVATGVVPTGTLVQSIPVQSVKNDVYVTASNPLPIALNDLNLGGTPAFKTSSSLFVRQDELLVYNNGLAALNKAPSATYFYYAGTWRKVAAGSPIVNDIIPAGAAIVLRKVSGTPASFDWSRPTGF